MTLIPENTAETTDSLKISAIFSESLNSMKTAGSLLLNELYVAPWAISIPNSTELTPLLELNQNVHIAAFHLVRRGQIEIEIKGGNKEIINEGEMVICFSGKAHTLYQGSSKPAYPFINLMNGGENIFKPNKDNKSQATSLICGIFILQDTLLNPLFEAMPALLKIKTDQGDYHSLSTTKNIIQLLISELDKPSFSHNYMVERYLELLSAQSIQSYIQSVPENKTGWLSAINDQMIRRVISAIHSQPDFDWSVAALAEIISLSPSRFAARFSQIMGISPMVYVTQWRMYLASKTLKETQFNVEQIANQVGYDNVAAFSRAFKRLLGLSPAHWRKQNQL